MAYRILADITMAAHFLFLVYVVLGGFLAWRWPKLWFAHAAVALYGLVITVFSIVCPLTPVEHRLRLKAGQEGLEPTGFVDTYIEGVLYPEEHLVTARVIAAIIIAISWVGVLVRVRRGARAKPQADDGQGDELGADRHPLVQPGRAGPPRRIQTEELKDIRQRRHRQRP